ncbi:RagB/SusD family nutrient uptake outer membrane protein [Dyadobacter jiangsuensis]|uniref:Putative outer membrane starch-binding protein n=1 Tax=Dyadobacter jiangsuensis TaxID=1591085 RepID=A0A2P8GBQ1_9BACT|nr:RagB/SusD family nutrient uptake outer membrane protein [Dyadobacter jiangsuensis]PSL31401.1 putative outer membrane starch-binding protein [Dyadobacter jiangsuensis]
MKRIYIKVLVATLLLNGIVSCNYLDKMPEDQLTVDMVFNDKVRTEEWLAGVYSSIPDPYWGNMRSIGYDPLSDDAAPSTGWEQFGWNVVSKQIGNWSPASSWDANYWVALPQRIRSAYIFINNVKPNVAQQLSEADVQLMKNEARFLIAYYHTLMLEAYGSIPLQLGLVSADASAEELMVGQTRFDTVVDWIDKELKDLSGVLPASHAEAQKFGRATSVMCLAVRARLLLLAASPLVNGNKDYAGFVNNKGEEIFNTNYNAQKWTRAADACRELIQLAESNGHKLYYEYNTDGTIDPFMSYQNMLFKRSTDGNSEILFARPDCNTWEYDKHSNPRGAAGNGGLGVTQSLVDAFFMKNGLPITDAASGYTEKGFSTAADVRNTKWAEAQGNGQVALAGTFNMYVNREPRFYISVLYNGSWIKREKRTTDFYSGAIDGGPTHDGPQNGYLLRKKVHPDHDPRNSINPYRPGILYRLGEAYLNYAEALNESSPGHADILKYVNLIRERGGIPALKSGLSQDAIRAAIRRERRVELNCEGTRYADIRRWKIGEEALNGNFWGMNFSGTEKDDSANNAKAFFKRTVYQKRVFTKKNYWFPIPQSEIDKNPNLVQNPFW